MVLFPLAEPPSTEVCVIKNACAKFLLSPWFLPGMLFMDGKLGERAGGESSSELATVLMASWYNGVELGMANLDIRDIMMDSGFWDRVGSGGMVYGVLEGRLPGRFTEAGWLAVGGGGPPGRRQQKTETGRESDPPVGKGAS